MSRRVLYLSVLLAVYVVVNALVHYAFDVAAIESAISQIRAVTEMKGRYDMAGLLIGLMPGLAYSIVLGLLVPLCGYFGAKSDSQGLVGCFCGCNALQCGCSICGLVMTVLTLALISSATPGIEHYLQECDPHQCTQWPDHFSPEMKQQHTVDCLAAGVWPDYRQQFGGSKAYPSICPKVVLKCETEDVEEPRPLHGVFGGSWPGPRVVSPLESTTFYPTFVRSGSILRGGGRPLEAPEDAVPAIAAVPASKAIRVPSLSSFLGRRLQFVPHRWRAPRAHHFDTDDIMKEIPMPESPIDSCKPEKKGIKILHDASVLVPELVPKLVLYMAIQALLLIPVILFGCLGFCWGKDLFNKLGQGYGQLEAAQPRVTNAEMMTVTPEAPPAPTQPASTA
ncbi:unnamed protein product [Durusdinium trenchii]|uniref:Uncharacterized protein n=1 Tax=Durusdinium trenchii TaxID=1381693 RepID=A0ABP0IU37_9DINO